MQMLDHLPCWQEFEGLSQCPHGGDYQLKYDKAHPLVDDVQVLGLRHPVQNLRIQVALRYMA